MITCPKCGKQNPDNGFYCTACHGMLLRSPGSPPSLRKQPIDPPDLRRSGSDPRSSNATRKCPRCGTENLEKLTHCIVCNEKLDGEPEPPPEEPSSPPTDEVVPAPDEKVVHSAGVCSKCGHTNPDSSRYCNSCGTPLLESAARVCPECGRLNPVDSRYCNGCGAHLPPAAPASPGKEESWSMLTVFNSRTCLKCLHSNPKQATLCEICGARL